MPAVRPGGKERWARRSAAAAQDYEAGIQAPRVDWESATVAAEQNHKAGTEASLREGRFVKGVKKSGNAWWKQQATTLGPRRFQEGVQAGQDTYEEGFAPVRAVIEQTKLPPRGPKGDPKNYDRVKTMGEALRRHKTGGKL